jgi:hypothetical protein
MLRIILYGLVIIAYPDRPGDVLDELKMPEEQRF